MAVEDISEVKRERVFSYESNDKKEKFVIREPTPDEINMCDIFRSKVWYDCMRKGIPTEEEIIDMLKNQGRFNEKKFNEKLDALNLINSEILQKMAMAESLEDLDKLHQEASDSREETLKHLKKKSSFTRHSVEVRSDHSYNMALMGVCVETINGKPVFIVHDEVDNLDIEKTFEKIDGWKDIEFINVAITNFMPFLMGFSEGKTKNAEDSIYDIISLRFKKDEEVEVENKVSDNDKEVEKDTEKENKNSKPKIIVETPKSEDKEVNEEVNVEAKEEAKEDPFDMNVTDFSDIKKEENNEETKKELTKANNRPKMSPAPTQERMTVKGSGQKTYDDEQGVDSTHERSGFRSGDEDTSYGDGSASPGGAPIRTKLNRE